MVAVKEDFIIVCIFFSIRNIRVNANHAPTVVSGKHVWTLSYLSAGSVILKNYIYPEFQKIGWRIGK